MSKIPTIYIGCMTGTSADKCADFTAASFDDDGMPIDIQNMVVEIPDDLRQQLLGLSQQANKPIKTERDKIESKLTDFLISAYQQVIQQLALTNYPKDKIILSPHGQTIDHQPLANPPYCDVLIDAKKIVDKLGYAVAANHRQECLKVSMAAPLAPVLIQKLFYDAQQNTVLINGGGIANICVLPKDKLQNILGFDTGPANGPLDSLVQYIIAHDPQNIPADLVEQIKLKQFDVDGAWASRGDVIDELFDKLNQHEFFIKNHKSADRADFGLDWILPNLKQKDYAWQDVLATVSEVIAMSIVQAISNITTASVLLYGGIIHNRYLINRVKELLAEKGKFEYINMLDLGFDPDFFESLLMAYLGFCVANRAAIDLSYCARSGEHARIVPGIILER